MWLCHFANRTSAVCLDVWKWFLRVSAVFCFYVCLRVEAWRFPAWGRLILEPVKARLCVDVIVALSLPIQGLFSIPVCQTLPAFTGLLWRWTCSYWYWLSNATPVTTAMPVLVWNDRSAHGRTHKPLTRPRLQTSVCRHRVWWVVYVAALCRSCFISPSVEILSALQPAGLQHTRSISTHQNRDCRWTAVVTVPEVAALALPHHLFYGNECWCRSCAGLLHFRHLIYSLKSRDDATAWNSAIYEAIPYFNHRSAFTTTWDRGIFLPVQWYGSNCECKRKSGSRICIYQE